MIRDRVSSLDQVYPFRSPGMAVIDHNQTAFQPRSELSFQRGSHGIRGLPGPDAYDARECREIVLPRSNPEAIVPDPDGPPGRRLGVRGIQPREEQLPEHRSGVFVGAIDTDLHVFPGSFVMVRFA